MSAPKILVIPASLRTGSHNAKLAAVAAYEFARAGVDVTRISLADFPLPIYDGDLQAKSGVPKHAVNLKRILSLEHFHCEHHAEATNVAYRAVQSCSQPFLHAAGRVLELQRAFRCGRQFSAGGRAPTLAASLGVIPWRATLQ